MEFCTLYCICFSLSAYCSSYNNDLLPERIEYVYLNGYLIKNFTRFTTTEEINIPKWKDGILQSVTQEHNTTLEQEKVQTMKMLNGSFTTTMLNKKMEQNDEIIEDVIKMNPPIALLMDKELIANYNATCTNLTEHYASNLENAHVWIIFMVIALITTVLCVLFFILFIVFYKKWKNACTIETIKRETLEMDTFETSL